MMSGELIISGAPERISSFTSRLFAAPSFIEGMARVLDLGGTLQAYNYSTTEALADHYAIYSDWLAVGDDISVALKEHEKTNGR